MRADNKRGWLITLHHAVAWDQPFDDASKRGIIRFETLRKSKIKGPQKRPGRVVILKSVRSSKRGFKMTSDEQALYKRKIIMLQ
jgi:hypothetical protein